MPLFQVWDAIIDPKIAIEHGYTNKKKAEKADKVPDLGIDFGSPTSNAASPSAPLASAGSNASDEPPVTTSEEDLNAFMPPTSRGSIDDKGLLAVEKDKALKSRPKTPPPPLPVTAKSQEDPSTWSQEFDEDTEFVDAADLLDEEPTINSKGGIGGKETMV
jgi:hypothetical protein